MDDTYTSAYIAMGILRPFQTEELLLGRRWTSLLTLPSKAALGSPSTGSSKFMIDRRELPELLADSETTLSNSLLYCRGLLSSIILTSSVLGSGSCSV